MPGENEVNERKPLIPCPKCDYEAKSKAGLTAHDRAKHRPDEAPVVSEKPTRAQVKKARAARQKQYVCVTPCYHNGVRYRRGRVAFFTNDYPKDKKGSMVHFELLDPTAPPPEVEVGPVAVSGASE